MTPRRSRQPAFRGYARAVEATRRLVSEHACVLMKIATEDEALTHEDVRRRFDAFSSAIPIELKIGGPGARGDLVLCRDLGIRHIIAPMVESAYGLIDFLGGVREVFGAGAKGLKLGVNIETEGAARDIKAVLKGDDRNELYQVTVGRGDLSRSMGRTPDDERVMKLAGSVIRCAHGRGYVTSVGGGVHPGNVTLILRRVSTEYVNTRNFAFRAAPGHEAESLRRAVRCALEAEILLCRATGTALARARAKALAERLRVEGKP